MAKSKMLNYWESVKAEEINKILNTIKDNKNIKIESLIPKIHVNPPFISKDKAFSYLEDLKYDGKIIVNSKNEVSICRC